MTSNPPSLLEWLTLAAILLSPLIAVQVEKWLERRREEKGRKLMVFRALMANRAAKLSQAYVEALNMIDLTFTGERDRAVREKWRECLDKFANFPKAPEVPKETDNDATKEAYKTNQTQYITDLKAHTASLDESLTDLMHEMAKTLNYDFDKVHIRRGAYIPQAHSDIEAEINLIRKGLVELLVFGKPLPLSLSTDEETDAEQAELRKLLISNYKGERPLPVKVTREE